MSPSLRTLTALLCAIGFAACTKPAESRQDLGSGEFGAAAAAAPAATSGKPSAAGPAVHQTVPTAAEAELALSMGRSAFEQAKFAEAEAQLKIASAGGKSEADGLLLQARTELAAKEHLTAARKALAANDLATAQAELRAIPSTSALQPLAEQLGADIEAARERNTAEFAAKASEALQAEIKKEAAGDQPAGDEQGGERGDEPQEQEQAAGEDEGEGE